MNYFNYLIFAVFLSFSSLPSLANEPDKPAEQPEGSKEPRFGTDDIGKDLLCKIFGMLPYNYLTVVGGVCRHWHSAKDKFNSDYMKFFKDRFPEAFALYSEEERNEVKNWEEELHRHIEAREYIEKHVRDFGRMEAKNKNGRNLLQEVLGFYDRELSRKIRLPIVRLSVAVGAWSGLDADGVSPLKSALHDPEFIALLLKNKSLDVDLRDPDGNTALHIACWYREFETVELLINAGADVNALSPDGFPLEDALRSEDWGDETNLNLFKIVDLLLEKGGRTHDHPILHYANEDTLDILLRKIPSLDVNQKDSYGQTALHYWFTSNFGIDNLRTMIKKGADVTMQDHGGDTPLLVLLHRLEKDECYPNDDALNSAQLLIESGPLCVNMKNKKGNTPLHYLSHPNAVMTALLLAYGADINAKNIKDQTPLDRQGARHGIFEDLRHENQIAALLMAAEHSPNSSPEEKKERIKELLEIEDLFEAHVPVMNGEDIDFLSIDKANFALWIALISKQPLGLIKAMLSQKGAFCDPIAVKLAERFHPEAAQYLEESRVDQLDFLGRVLAASEQEQRNEFGKRPRVEVEDEITPGELTILMIRDNPGLSYEEMERMRAEILDVPTPIEFEPPNDNNAPDPDEAIPMDIDLPHDNNAPDEAAVLIQGDTATRYFFGLGS